MAGTKISANGWTRIALVKSSDGSKSYVQGLRLLKSGKVEIGCDCPSRIYRKGTKAHKGFDVTCKHNRALLDGTVALADLSLTAEGVRFLDAMAEGKSLVEANAIARTGTAPAAAPVAAPAGS